ncbi:MAG TPA: Clp protease N-terminal domain-containing protein [Acidimicrobiia bacterium]|nr:Clp protease N-terminal domain-containing protein [Acidimicrobiia bacterium]
MTLANDEAQRQKHTKVTLSDLLVGHIRYGIWAKTGALAACGVSLDEAREHASNIRHQGKSNGEPVLRTRQVQRVIAHASQIATDLGSKNIEPEHLLVALVRFTDGNNRNGAVDVLDELGVSTATIEETIQAESVRLADLDEVREAIFDTVVPFLERVERAQSTNGLGPELMGVQSRLAAVHQGIVAGRRSTVGPKTPVHELPAQGL